MGCNLRVQLRHKLWRKSQFGKQMESNKMRAHDYEIKTERLLLRPMTIADTDAVIGKDI